MESRSGSGNLYFPLSFAVNIRITLKIKSTDEKGEKLLEMGIVVLQALAKITDSPN